MLCPCVQGMLFLSWSKTDNSCPFLPWPQKAPLQCRLRRPRIWNVLSGSQTVNDAFGTLSTIRCLLTCMSVELLLTAARPCVPSGGASLSSGAGPWESKQPRGVFNPVLSSTAHGAPWGATRAFQPPLFICTKLVWDLEECKRPSPGASM